MPGIAAVSELERIKMKSGRSTPLYLFLMSKGRPEPLWQLVTHITPNLVRSFCYTSAAVFLLKPRESECSVRHDYNSGIWPILSRCFL
jgi:hypothetical protein